jgi:hypothetical protein
VNGVKLEVADISRMKRRCQSDLSSFQKSCSRDQCPILLADGLKRWSGDGPMRKRVAENIRKNGACSAIPECKPEVISVFRIPTESDGVPIDIDC